MSASHRLPRRPRPRTITITLIGLVLLGGLNAWRAITIGQQAARLLALEPSLDPRLRLAGAAFWSLFFSLAALALLLRRARSTRAIPALLALYGLYQLLLVALFAASPAPRAGLPADLVRHTAGALFAYWALNRAGAQRYFQPAPPRVPRLEVAGAREEK